MHFIARLTSSIALLLALAACGGAPSPADMPAQRARQAATEPASAHTALIQNVYIAYFGRPADPGGLAYWAEVYRNAGAPTNTLDLYKAYNSNPAIQGLLDIFATSKESIDLYPGDNTAFITAIYQNILSRAPDSAGRDYWVGLLDRRLITRPGAALAIMAGARSLDLEIIARKAAVAAEFTAQLNTTERSKGYDGAAANVIARDMLRRVGADTDTTAFKSSIEATIQTLVAVPASAARVFTGTVATGRPIANAVITIEDLEGAYAEATTSALGGYLIDMSAFVRLGKTVSNLKPPFFLHAKYKENGQDKELHSVTAEAATGAQQMNATPATDALARSYAWPVTLDGRNLKDPAGAAPLGVPNDPDKLQRIKTNIKAMYGDLASGVGDIVRDRFVPDPNSSPMDAALERTRTTFKDGAVAISDAAGNTMARAAVTRLDSNILPASDTESVSAGEARQAVSNRGAFSSTIEPLQGGDSPVIKGVSPSEANLNEVTKFTVTGTGLSSTLAFNLSGCESITALPGGTSQSRSYSCKPVSAVPQEGLIKDGPGGKTLYIFHVAVKKFQPPSVVSFGPSYADQGVEAVFTIRGFDFTSGMRFVMNGCSPAREVNSGNINGVSSTMREFACTPTIAGLQTAEIYDQTGVRVAGFAVQVAAKSKAMITSYTPDRATVYSLLNLAFRGTDLPAGMAVSLTGCAGMGEDGGTAVERRFSCIPMQEGLMQGSVWDKPNGTLLKSFTVTVSALQVEASPLVKSYSPDQATVNQSVVFTFTGTDLTSNMGFTLDGCINVRELSGGSSTQRQYSCTPTSAGVKNGQINGQSFTVTVSGSGSGSTDPGTGSGTGSSSLPCFATLQGVWTNNIVGGTWTFTAPNHAKVVLDALNYGSAAQQITEMDLTSCTSTSMSYKLTRAALVNTVDPSYAYDKSARTAPSAYDWNKLYTQAYTVSGNSLNLGNYTYTKSGSSGTSSGATGKVAFWSRRTTGTISLTIDGVTVGTINSYYTSPPECNGSGTVTRELSVGTHTFKGSTYDGSYGPTTFTITAGACLLYELK